MLDLGNLGGNSGKNRKKREGRGRSGYGGKTAGRGHNGQKQRSGCSIRKGFEGGQTPLYRRLPKRQFLSLPNRKVYTIINVSDLMRYEWQANEAITAELLLERGIISKIEKSGVKLLGEGEISVALSVQVQAHSASAKEKIEGAGGKVELLS